MSVEMLAKMALKHWEEWLPDKVATLIQEGILESVVHSAAVAAQREIDALMKQGFQAHEAEEKVLSEYILLTPEPGAGLLPWEAEELAEKEAKYQAMMKDYQKVWDLDDLDD